MRSSIILTVALFILIASTRTFAQYAQIDPRTLPAEIAAQETIVASAASKDWQAWLKLAVLLEDAGSYRQSEDAYRQTIALLRAPDPLTVADVFDHMATMYIASGRPSEAEPIERHALAIREYQHDKLGAGVSHMHMAMILLGENALRPAQAEAQTAVNLLVPEYGDHAGVSVATPEEKMNALVDLSLIQSASGASQTALAALQGALRIAHENYPDDSIPVGYIEFTLGQTLWKTGDATQGDILMDRGVQKLSSEISWSHPAYLGTLRQYKVFLLATKQQGKAQQIAAKIATLEKLDHPLVSFAVASASAANSHNLPK
ncbi:MAG TPA: tetratricopeptide repeat protein [Acidobacteriaceae bacterium]|nr:tetratricopeptide repeat protein [Acidobacteriaceae bacterium]